MAIEAGWDPDTGMPLPDDPPFVPLSDEELAAWAVEDALAPISAYSFDDEEEPPLATEPVEPVEPGWAVPGVSEPEASSDGEVSAGSLALLAEGAAAVRARRLAGARLYRAINAIRDSDVLDETGYRRMSRLLEDHLRLDPTTVRLLERQADALRETVTPTGATTPADLPATAAVVEDGLVDEHHVEIIRKTMQRLGAVPGLGPAVLATAEEQLAALATTHSPKALFSAAKVIADRLDPDGAAPKDDDASGNELRYTKRRNGDLHAKLVLRERTAAALFDDAIRAATPAPASSVVADPDTGEAPESADGNRGHDPRDEADRSLPARQASGLLDLISASHHAGLNEPDPEPGTGQASMPFPDPGLDETVPGNDARTDVTGTGSDANRAPEPATDEPSPEEDAGTGATGTGSDATSKREPEADEPSMFGPGAPTPDHESDATTESEADEPPPPRRPWTPPDVDTMALPGRERVTLTVTLDYETLRQQLADTSTALALLGDSTWIRPDTARRLACDADIIPMLLGSKGEVLDVGRKTRSIPTATARAVTRRDRHCAFPGCRRRARHSEIHHIIHWANGGHTEPDNLVCLCRYHHDLVHHSGWDVHMTDHMPWFRPPTWLDPTRQPRHNRPWQAMDRAA
ncbi:HNH endonuclease signature motif containing protein [Actinomycetospora soli]|uniref:HNH endonuclease signature motif containing protein n=1 Tax=Actinomycetospora soli TaxID=2893887 RepID=UPI001E5F5FDF|nr:HNH endonuclease signature motif containing protein [Actinomycetospora soli]MCD2188235.1 DUF222 domain-containing protein [Actinomycetospora soli]